MTNLEKLALDICQMKHRDKIMAALPLILAPHDNTSTTSKDKKEE